MGLIAFIILGILALIGAAFSNLLSDEFKAWQPWIVRKIIALAVSWMPAEERERWHEEWSAYCTEVPGQFGQIFASLGFVISAWRVNRQSLNYRLLKRLIDVGFSLAFFFILAPILLGISFVIRFLGKRPIFYKQRRLGRDGREIHLLKFSTFDKDGNIDAIGSFLRRLRLDELPQLINVFRGDMSIVGPRPRATDSQTLDQNRDADDLDVAPGLLPPPIGDAEPSIWRELRHIAHTIVEPFLPFRGGKDSKD
ncbi:sugar transferase [Rhizobium wenxiniae]|uniref:sugar transferase n=1 Tax=Rhizobium wenxiniae TaxID=1737357 RepID=UPI003C1BE427